MASINRNKVVRPGHFSGVSRVHSAGDGGLGQAVRQILVQQARNCIAASPPTDLTDNSGGTAGSDFAAVTRPSEADLTGLTTGVTATSLNTAADTVMNAYAVILDNLNDVSAVLGLPAVGEGPGTIAVADTIAVIDDSASANTGNTDSCTFASGSAVIDDLLNWQATVVGVLHTLQDAVGLTRTAWGTGASVQGTAFAGFDGGTTAISNGANGADATSTFLLTQWDALVDVLSDNVALIADKADLIKDVTADAAPVHGIIAGA